MTELEEVAALITLLVCSEAVGADIVIDAGTIKTS